MNQFDNSINYLDGATSGNPSVVKDFMARTFMWMGVALGITALVAFVFSSNIELMYNFLDPLTGRRNLLGTIVMFAPLAFVLTMSFGFHKLSTPLIALLFIVYSAVNGITFSFILAAYTSSSIVGAFVGAAVMFSVMAIMGYRTNKDLTSFGRLMMMGLIGLVVMSLVNIFMQSSMMSYIAGFIGVAVFTGLTAYDVQKLKNMAIGLDGNGDSLAISNVNKLALFGALNLYLDFINLFISLLRVFGSKK
jgi:uncharacterized protein